MSAIPALTPPWSCWPFKWQSVSVLKHVLRTWEGLFTLLSQRSPGIGWLHRLIGQSERMQRDPGANPNKIGDNGAVSLVRGSTVKNVSRRGSAATTPWPR
ncbi:hypothetical protein SRL2020400_57430 [Mycobacterium kiyosense]|nr:hypothetical protein SRL2020400_57430 [Mycobacterium kiyosense]